MCCARRPSGGGCSSRARERPPTRRASTEPAGPRTPGPRGSPGERRMKTETSHFSASDLQDLVDVRRDLHAHPETAFQEVRTSGFVAGRLRALGLEVKTGVGRTGVLATVKGGAAGRTVLLRADMDALPHLGVDPVVCLSQMVSALQNIASREADPFQEVVVSVTQIKAGTAFNIIPEMAWMNGTVRVFDRELWETLPGRFERFVRGIAQAFGCEIEIKYQRHNGPTINDPKMAALARTVACEVVGEENVVEDIRTMGGEDFAALLQKMPGCFIAIGSRNEARGLTHGHHHPRFDVDEQCLEIGAEILLCTARRFLES